MARSDESGRSNAANTPPYTHKQKTHLLGPLRQVLVDAVVAGVQLAAGEPRHVPALEASLGHAVEVSEPLQGRPGRVSPKLVRFVKALLVHRLCFLRRHIIAGVFAPRGVVNTREESQGKRKESSF